MGRNSSGEGAMKDDIDNLEYHRAIWGSPVDTSYMVRNQAIAAIRDELQIEVEALLRTYIRTLISRSAKAQHND